MFVDPEENILFCAEGITAIFNGELLFMHIEYILKRICSLRGREKGKVKHRVPLNYPTLFLFQATLEGDK